jgi:hypothetical protein
MADPRCARQRLLTEVGIAGQERLAETPALVVADAGSDVATTYLRRAGVRDVRTVDAPAPEFPHSSHLRYAAPHAVARGSWVAVDHVRRVLGLD